jgi:hypothetical protein
MGSRLNRLSHALGGAAIALTLAVLAPPAADARTSVGVGFGFGFPLYPPPPPMIYAPPPAYYVAPPPIVYAPSPPPQGYYPPQAAAPAAAGQQCREYQSTAIIDDQPQQTFGTACLQPDGRWRIVK